MKKFSLFALAAAGLLLGACSSDDSIDSKVNGGEFTDGAFIGISLQLPSTATATRANEDFDDGEADEFAVKNATLYLFQGASEAGAKYMAHYTIGTNFQDDPAKNITNSYCEATLIENEVADKIKNAANNVYAYVIVNHNGVIPAMDENVTFADFCKWEFNVIGADIAAEKNIGEGGLLMTSSPICDTKGGSVAAPTKAENYKTLIPVDKTKIFSTAEAAKAQPAACIYVERAAVKITVSSKVEKTTLGDNEVAVTFGGWQIINYEPTYYNTRQVDPVWGDWASDALVADFPLFKAANAYRFVSGTEFGPQIPGTGDHTTGFRTYFAKDVQYDKDATLLRPQADINGTWIEMGKHGYTTENTFDVARMDWPNTTQVALKASFGNGSFYTLNGGDVMYKEADIKTLLATSIFNLPTVTNLMNTAVQEVAVADPTTTAPKPSYTGKIVVNFDTPTASKDGVTYTAEFKISSADGGTLTEDAVSAATTTALNNAIAAAYPSFVISFHQDGVAYYNVRIKHFGDYETPWSSTKPFATVVPGITIPQIYGYTDDKDEQLLANKRFLGRYGVVRDNWYKLEVTGVKHIGTAEPVDVTKQDIPDDEIENYISIHVHILPWVLRNQDVVL
jgi:hypothetical protein